MKKSVIISIAFLLLGLGVKAQLRPHFISINGGISMPVGEYESFDTARVGAANAGKFVSFEFGLYPSKIVGFGVNVGAFTNSLDIDQIKEKFQVDNASANSITVNGGDWLNMYATGGIYFTIPIKEIFRLDFKFLAGGISTQQPQLEIEYSESGVKYKRLNTSTDDLALVINYGAHLRIKLIKNFGIRVGAETFTSLAEFNNQTELLSDNKKQITKQSVEQTISTLNVSVGLAFTL